MTRKAVETAQTVTLAMIETKFEAIVSEVRSAKDELLQGQDDIKQMVQTKAKTEKGRALARQDKQRAVAKFEIELQHIDMEPFARGGFGIVHMATFQGDDVVLKKFPLEGMPLATRDKIKNFQGIPIGPRWREQSS